MRSCFTNVNNDLGTSHKWSAPSLAVQIYVMLQMEELLNGICNCESKFFFLINLFFHFPALNFNPSFGRVFLPLSLSLSLPLLFFPTLIIQHISMSLPNLCSFNLKPNNQTTPPPTQPKKKTFFLSVSLTVKKEPSCQHRAKGEKELIHDLSLDTHTIEHSRS